MNIVRNQLTDLSNQKQLQMILFNHNKFCPLEELWDEDFFFFLVY